MWTKLIIYKKLKASKINKITIKLIWFNQFCNDQKDYCFSMLQAPIFFEINIAIWLFIRLIFSDLEIEIAF